jgi:hypothetical protein
MWIQPVCIYECYEDNKENKWSLNMTWGSYGGDYEDSHLQMKLIYMPYQTFKLIFPKVPLKF